MKELRGALGHGLLGLCVNPSLGVMFSDSQLCVCFKILNSDLSSNPDLIFGKTDKFSNLGPAHKRFGLSLGFLMQYRSHSRNFIQVSVDSTDGDTDKPISKNKLLVYYF